MNTAPDEPSACTTLGYEHLKIHDRNLQIVTEERDNLFKELDLIRVDLTNSMRSGRPRSRNWRTTALMDELQEKDDQGEQTVTAIQFWI